MNVSFQEGHTTISITIFGFWAARGPLSFHLKFPCYSFKVSIALGYHSANLGSLLNPTSNCLSSLPNKGTPDGCLLQPLLLRDMTHWVIISFFRWSYCSFHSHLELGRKYQEVPKWITLVPLVFIPAPTVKDQGQLPVY